MYLMSSSLFQVGEAIAYSSVFCNSDHVLFSHIRGCPLELHSFQSLPQLQPKKVIFHLTYSYLFFLDELNADDDREDDGSTMDVHAQIPQDDSDGHSDGPDTRDRRQQAGRPNAKPRKKRSRAAFTHAQVDSLCSFSRKNECS